MSGEGFNNFSVFLELQRRNEIGEHRQNRIPLFVNDISINTNKTVMSMGVPFSGMVRGEATSLAFDMGMAQKTVSLTGVLLGQNITKIKNNSGDDNEIDVNLTSFEMAQLIHSNVDSSVLQDDQSLNKLVVLIPSRVDENYGYHAGVNGTTDISQLPLIPFSWKNRKFDNDFTAFTKNPAPYFTPYTDTTANNTTSVGMKGFIRSFSTNITGTDFPSINFTLEFEIATVISDNPLS